MMKSNFKKALKKFKTDVVDAEISKKLDNINIEGKVDKSEFDEYKNHEHDNYAKKSGYARNRIMITDTTGNLVVKDDLLPSQLNHLANVTSDIQEQLLNRSTLDHKHEGLYITKEELEDMDFSGLAKDIEFDNKVASTLNSTNVQEALSEVDHKIVNLAHVVSENKVEVNERISEVSSNLSSEISELKSSNNKKLDKSEVGITVAELEGGKLKKSQLPDHYHTDFVPHEHEQYALKTDVKESIDSLNERLDNHTHKEFDNFALKNHTHKEFEDLAGNHTHPEFQQLGERISNLSDDVSDNRTDINRLQTDKSDKSHTHKDLSDRLNAIEVDMTDHTHSDLVNSININASNISKNASEINTLKNQKADKEHLDTHLEDLDKRYSKVGHTHDFNTTHDHDDRYSKLDHNHDDRYVAMFADILHNHNDVYAEKIHTHNYADKVHTHSEYSPFIHSHAEIDELREDVNSINMSMENLATKDEIASTKEEINTTLNVAKDELDATITSNIEEVNTKLASKSDIAHRHSYETLENVPNEFNPTAHNHSTDDIDGLIELIRENSAGGLIYPIAFNETEKNVLRPEYYYGDIRRYSSLNENHPSGVLSTAISAVGYAFIPRNTTINHSGSFEFEDNWKIIGEDKDTSKIVFTVSSTYVYNKVNSNIVIKNVTLERTNYATVPLLSLYGSNLLLENVVFKNATQSIVAKDSLNNITIKNCEITSKSTTDTSNRGITFDNCENIIIEGTKITNSHSAIYLGGDYYRNVKITNCNISSNSRGIYLKSGDSTSSIHIDNTQFTENVEFDITLGTSPITFIKNCYFSASTTSSYSINGVNITNLYLENNIFTGYNLAIKNKEDRKVYSNLCRFIKCTSKYEYPLSVLAYEEALSSLSNPYPTLNSETGVTNPEFQYGDIRRYGGVNNNTETDLVALTNALASFDVAIIPSNFTLTVGSSFIIPEGKQIVGECKHTSILKFISNNSYRVEMNSNTTLKNLTVHKATKGGYGIGVASGLNNILIENVILKNVAGGVYFNNSDAVSSNIKIKGLEAYSYSKTDSNSLGLGLRGCDNLVVEDSIFDGFDVAVNFYSNSDLITTDTRFNNCEFSNNNKGMYLHTTNTDSTLTLNNCKFISNVTIDIDSTARSMPHLVVKNSLFEGYDNTSSIAIDSTKIVKFYIENCNFKGYKVAINNTDTRKIESNKCHFVNCTMPYLWSDQVTIYEDILASGVASDGSGDGSGAKTYPVLIAEDGLVTNSEYYYGDIRRYGGQPLVTEAIPTKTNNNLAIQSAIKSVGKCYIPQGNWIITSDIDVNVDHSTIIGAGMDATYLLYATDSVRVLMNANYLNFTGMTVRHVTKGTNINTAFYSPLDKIEDVVFKDVRIEEVSGGGITFYGYASGYPTFDNVEVINTLSRRGVGIAFGGVLCLNIRNCFFFYLNSGIRMTKTNKDRTYGRYTIINNRFINCEYGMQFCGSSVTSTIQVQANMFRVVDKCIDTFNTDYVYNLSVIGNSFLNKSKAGTAINANKVYQLNSTGNIFVDYQYAIYNSSSVYSSNKYNVVSSGDSFVNITTQFYTSAKVNKVSAFV